MTWSSGLVEKLQRGEPARFRPHGNSMTPLIKSGQLVTVTPVDLKETEVWYGEKPVPMGSVVLCKVHGRIMLHKVTAYRNGQYQISNNHGHINGMTNARNIFGILTHVEP